MRKNITTYLCGTILLRHELAVLIDLAAEYRNLLSALAEIFRLYPRELLLLT